MVYSYHDKVVIRSLAIASSSLSIVAGALMVYWFLKLKNRSFRHQLVMLLVMSDSLKALAEIIYPASTLLLASTDPSVLCTVTGYISNIFVEAGDIATLIIAVHTALCIFKPPSGGISSDKAGLYPWRYQVYAIWAAWSILMASLAFLNKAGAYTSAISWCFLPIRPFYWRITLSWAPRYAILLFIFVLYLSIFIYVKRKFHSYHRVFAGTLDGDSSVLGTSTSEYQLNAGSSTDFNHSAAELEIQMMNAPLASPGLSPIRPPMISRSSSNFDRPTLVFLHSEDRFPFQLRRESILTINEKDMPRRHDTTATAEKTNPDTPNTEESDDRPKFGSRKSTLLNFTKPAVLKNSFFTSTEVSPISPTARAPVDPLKQERARIVKQLKHLFVFPVIYFLMWILPFAFHLTQYHDKFAHNPVRVLAYISAVIIPLHGFIDVVIYARNEKPWRSWRYDSGARNRRRSTFSSSKPQDLLYKSGQEQIPQIDVVAQRQEQEIIEAKQKKMQRRSQPLSNTTLSSTTEWWDLEMSKHDIDEETVKEQL